MSSRRSSSSRITEDEISHLVCKLQQLMIPEVPPSSTKASTSKILKEACNYIKSLHREVDGLSESLSEILASSMDLNSIEAGLLRSLLMLQQQSS